MHVGSAAGLAAVARKKPEQSMHLEAQIEGQSNRGRVNSDASRRPNKLSLFERRRIATGISLPELHSVGNKSSLALGRIINAIKIKALSYGFNEKCTNTVVSRHEEIKFYRVKGHDEQNIYVHSLRSEVKRLNDDYDQFGKDFWLQIADSKVQRIVALADPPFKPKYMPPASNKGGCIFVPDDLNVGDSRSFDEDVEVTVKEINSLETLRELPSSTTNAREVIVELKVSDINKSVADEYNVYVDQIYGWDDAGSLKPEFSKQIVNRLDCGNVQIHCEEGKNRSPAAIVMYQLYLQKELLSAENIIEKIALEVAKMRHYRHMPDAINDAALETIILYALDLLKLQAEDLFPITPSPLSGSVPATPLAAFDIQKC
ncbi:hypothetical protein [uncultured Endozoicomonas sp.]|uniref:hypothetical protein n=1 Tax=uncultured Endozoicomonas sp. TaxID=432652 RepID=UPI0026198379|nr:hypothetical protein [uncultured Endozoicomonas sp.]